MAVIHELSYKGYGIRNIVHKNRLKNIVAVFKIIADELQRKKGQIVVADFGCSNGFIISKYLEIVEEKERWSFFGFDHNENLLSLARERGIPNTHFSYFDLNKYYNKLDCQFDFVSCMETLEHTGNYKIAFENLYRACRTGGVIMISLPNEIGFPGMMKYAGRKIRKYNTYSNFFYGKSELDYFYSLLIGERLDIYRDQERSGWAEHLGFDYRCFEEYVVSNYINKFKCIYRSTAWSFLKFNKIYVIEKIS